MAVCYSSYYMCSFLYHLLHISISVLCLPNHFVNPSAALLLRERKIKECVLGPCVYIKLLSLQLSTNIN